MQFTKLFKVKFTGGLVKGVRLAPAKLNPLFSLRIVNYMYLTHAARTTTTIVIITITKERMMCSDPREATEDTNQIQQIFAYNLQGTLLSCQKYKGKTSLAL